MKISKHFLFAVLFITSFTMSSQNDKELPYYEIPEASETYTSGTVLARMIDGLGFRYYWATEGLRAEDLAFKPSEEARTTEETVDHILGLSKVILNAAMKEENVRDDSTAKMAFDEKRKATLQNLQKAAEIFRKVEKFEGHDMVFGPRSFPVWNLINGPIADAIWHCGQVVSFRRSSGNPFNSKVSVLAGKVRE